MPKQLIHGRLSTYRHAKCRCAPCRAANAQRTKRLREQRKSGQHKSEFTHGASGYSNWGCRCPICTEANTAKAAPAVRRYQKEHRDEVNARHLRRYARHQADTADRATRRGQEWTGPELEIAARSDLTTREAAVLLGRTFAGVEKMRQRLKTDPKVIALAGVSRSQTEAL